MTVSLDDDTARNVTSLPVHKHSHLLTLLVKTCYIITCCIIIIF